MADYTVGDTVFKRFTTRQFSDGVPTTLANSPVVSAYEDDSITQITAGITLGVDHDGVGGLNLLTIVATGANGYEAGKSYDLVITTGTVGGVSVVGEVVWHFTLSAEAAAVDLANATDGLTALRTLLLDVPTVSEFDARTLIAASYFDPAADAVATVTAVTNDVGITATAVDNIWNEDATAHQTQGSFGQAIGDPGATAKSLWQAVVSDAAGASVAIDVIAVKAETALIVVDTAEIGTAGAGLSDITLNAASIDLVWDEVLTGATHNVVNSSGRRLRIIQESGSYSDGHVYIDTVNGTVGDTSFENGVDILPVKTVTEMNTVLAAVGLSRISISPNSSVTFAAAQENQEFHGESWTLALGGQAIGGSHVDGAEISGTGTCATEAHFEHCELGTMTIGIAHFDECDIEGTVTLANVSGTYRFFNCMHSGTSVIDFGTGASINTTVHIHHYNGALTIENLGNSGTDVLHFDSSGGQLTLAASCVGGTLNFRGTAELINNGSGITINRGGDVVNDVAGVQSDTDNIQTRLPAALVNSRMDSALDATGMESGAVDQIWDEAMVETTGAPAITGTFRAAFEWIFALSRNRITQTATLTTLRNDADAADLATSVVSDDATTYDRGEWST